jgi:transposase
MTKQVRRNYTAEFKREAVRLVTEEGYKVAEAARSLDINTNMLGRWVRQAREGSEAAFPGKGNLSPEQEEIRTLRE